MRVVGNIFGTIATAFACVVQVEWGHPLLAAVFGFTTGVGAAFLVVEAARARA